MHVLNEVCAHLGLVDFGLAEVDKRGVGKFALLAEFAVEGNLLGDGFAVHVETKLVDIAFACGGGGEVLLKLFLAGGNIGIIPVVLVGEEEIFELLPVALDGGGVGSGGGRSTVGVVALDIVAVDDGDLAIVVFDELVELGVDRGATFALIIGIFEDEDGRVGVTFDIFGEIARFCAGSDDGAEIFGSFSALADTDADSDTKDCNDNCDNDSCFLVHASIIAYLEMSETGRKKHKKY